MNIDEARIEQQVTQIAKSVGAKPITPEQERKWHIYNADFLSRKSEFLTQNNEQAYIDGLNRLYAMKTGLIPFEEGKQAVFIEHVHTVGEKTRQTFWYAQREHMRPCRIALYENLGLAHLPHAMAKDQNDRASDAVVRFSVNHVSKSEAERCYAANTHIFLAMKIKEKKERVEVLRKHTDQDITNELQQEEEMLLPDESHHSEEEILHIDDVVIEEQAIEQEEISLTIEHVEI